MAGISGFESYKPRSKTARMALAALAAGGVGFLVFFYVFYYGPIYPPTTWAPEQPIPFSHLVHAGDNEIDCQYCHTYARRSEMAGLPSVSTCMNCHRNLKTESPLIIKVSDYFDEQKPIEWIKVYDLPDHVWFSHKRHILKDIDCHACHGEVHDLEVQTRMVDHKMTFCLDCHQKNGASTDCWTCHT